MKVRVCENFISMIHISALTSRRSHEIPIVAHEVSGCMRARSVWKNIYDQQKVKVYQSITFPSIQCILMASFCVLISRPCKKELYGRLYNRTRFISRSSCVSLTFMTNKANRLFYVANNGWKVYEMENVSSCLF